MTTIAKLHPEGLAIIDLNPEGDPNSADFVIDLGTLDLHESERQEVAYSEGANVDGGEAISYHGPLTPIEFRVTARGDGASEGAARAQMLQNAQTLEQAIRAGGLFQYRPQGLPSTYRSTYYHFIQSKLPGLKPQTGNNWDGALVETEPLNVAAIELEVFLQSQPYATSDPDRPEVVLSPTTVYNQDDGQVGHVTIPAASVKGTVPALTQLRIRNMVAGTWAAIGKMWHARRADPGDNFNPILEGGTPDDDSSIWWSTESDNTRRSNNFQRYAPPEAANNLWASLSYTIANITEHEGKVAVAVVCRSLAERGAWDLKAALEVAGTEVETGIVNVPKVGTWVVCIGGELDIPPTPISSDESYSLTLKLYLRRTSGDENHAIDIDFVKFLYVDEFPQQVTISDGFTNSYKLLLENFDDEICHVVDQSTLAFEKTAEPLCPLLQLEPRVDNRLDFIWGREKVAMLEDDFGDYEAWNWAPLSDFEDKNKWNQQTMDSMIDDTTHYIEGSQSIEFGEYGDVSIGYASIPGLWDFTGEGRFGNDDYVYVATYNNYSKAGNYDPINVYLRFWDGTDSFSGDITAEVVAAKNAWAFIKKKKSDFTQSGSPNWATIDGISVRLVTVPGGHWTYVSFDDWRIVKADPDDATQGNDTGTVWDFMRDVWHIEEQADTDKALGCLDNTAALEQVALIHEEPPANIKYLAQVRAKRDDGEVGLVFRCEDGTSGSEDMAAFFIDTTNDKLELRKWAAGSPSDIATALDETTAPDTDYWLGVWILDDSMVRCYFGTSKATIWDEETESFLASARKFNVTDAVFASGGALESGQCGLLSIGTLGRFDNIELYAMEGHMPGDTIQVEAKALYRTISPFRE